MIAGTRFVQGITNHLVIRLPEWAMTYFMFGFGVQLWQPQPTFPTSRTFDVMARVMTEDHWACCALLVALARGLALAFNGTYGFSRRWSPLVRSLAAFVSAGAWFCILLGMWLANPASTAITVYFGFMMIDILLSIFIAKPAGAAMRERAHAR